MNHTAGAKFQPSRIFTGRAALAAADQALNIQLKTGLYKREKAGTQPYGNLLPENYSIVFIK